MNISNGVYKSIRMNWDTFTFPVAEGTPVSASGVEANDKNAIGIIPQGVEKQPLVQNHYILVSGTVDGLTYDLSKDANIAMAGIDFIGMVKGGGSGLPDVTAADENKVPTVNSQGKWVVDYPYIDYDDISDVIESTLLGNWFATVTVDTSESPAAVTSDKDFSDFFDDTLPLADHPMFAKLTYYDFDTGNTVVDTCPIALEVSYYMGQLVGVSAYFTSSAAGVTIRWNSDGTVTIDS